MQRLQGIAVSPGVAIGEALVLDNEGFRIPRRFLPRDAVQTELARLHQAIADTTAEIEISRKRISDQLGDDYASIFSAHVQMLNDPRLRQELEEMIRDRHYSPEYSVSRAMRRYAKVFQSLEGAYMAERANDIFDIEKRLLTPPAGREARGTSRRSRPRCLVLARNLTPSETAGDEAGVHPRVRHRDRRPRQPHGDRRRGPRDPGGGRRRAVPGRRVRRRDRHHRRRRGRVILRPDEETLARYRHEADRAAVAHGQALRARRQAVRNARRRRHPTAGEHRVPWRDRLRRSNGRVEGIGLYRTEFLFLTGDRDPDREEHYDAYTERRPGDGRTGRS